MKPILVYTKEEAARNAFVADKICTALDAVLVTPDYRGEAAYVINRSNDAAIAEYYEQQGLRVFNPAAFTRLANDKQACYDFMGRHGIEILPTRYRTPPFVKKPKNGHGGQGVVWCTSAEDYDESMVCQQPADETGKDVRVWVLGGEMMGAMLRESRTDFRANYCLGGSATPYTLNASETALVKRIISLVQGDYYGIDFLFHRGHLVFNELEDAVGARMLYDLTDFDIIGRYCDYIQIHF